MRKFIFALPVFFFPMTAYAACENEFETANTSPSVVNVLLLDRCHRERVFTLAAEIAALRLQLAARESAQAPAAAGDGYASSVYGNIDCETIGCPARPEEYSGLGGAVPEANIPLDEFLTTIGKDQAASAFRNGGSVVIDLDEFESISDLAERLTTLQQGLQGR